MSTRNQDRRSKPLLLVSFSETISGSSQEFERRRLLKHEFLPYAYVPMIFGVALPVYTNGEQT